MSKARKQPTRNRSRSRQTEPAPLVSRDGQYLRIAGTDHYVSKVAYGLCRT